jgi:hypothetical protein
MPDEGRRSQNGASSRDVLRERVTGAVARLVATVDESVVQAALAADTDADMLAALGLTSGDGATQRSAAGDLLAPVRALGEQAKRDILAMQGALIDAAEVSARLGIDASEIEQRRRDGLLIAVPLADGPFGFPTWQFLRDGLLPGLERVLRDLGVQDAWTRAAFFVSGDVRLDGRTPLDMLLDGEIEAVRRAAAAYGGQGQPERRAEYRAR